MSIDKLSNLNPNICEVHLVETRKVGAFVADNYACDVTLNSGVAWDKIYTTPGKTTYEEPQQDDPAGPYFNQKLELMYPGDNAEACIRLANFENGRFLAVMKYASGHCKLVGSIENPCMMKIGYSTEKGGRVVTITRKSGNQALNFEF